MGSSARSTSGAEGSSPTTGPESPSTPTSETSLETSTWVKAKKAMSPDDHERWEESDIAPTFSPMTADSTLVITAFTQNQRDELRDLGDVAAALSGEGTHQTNYIASAFSSVGSPARTSASPGSEPDSLANDPDSSSSTPASLSLFDPDGFSSRTYRVSSLATAVGTSESCLERWPTSGTASRGVFSTAVSSECRSDDAGCSSSEPSLTMILQPPHDVPDKYSLSARAAHGILRRAEKRGKVLPGHLRTVLMEVASQERLAS